MALFASISCEKSDPETTEKSDYRIFTSMSDFLTVLQEVKNDTVNNRLEPLIDSLKKHNQLPFVIDDSVAFIYYGQANLVQWAGDFNDWEPGGASFTGTNMSNELWLCLKSFPSDARLDYKVVVNSSNWILDPLNKYIQYSGFGPNSELRMPEWEFPKETLAVEGVTKGSISSNILIESSLENLGYDVQYKVYTPFNYDQLDNLPVIYITDGHEYADNKLGAVITVIDNLIYEQKIEPVIAVFIDPREPGNLSNNRRLVEYRTNQKFADFVTKELVPAIDANYKTDTSAQRRAILGTSYGGWNSAYFGLTESSTFKLIGMHSPAYDQATIQAYNTSEKLPLKIYMSTGTINDTQDRARQLKAILESKDYPLLYKEVNQGHSWGNWRGLIDEPLIYFFGNQI